MQSLTEILNNLTFADLGDDPTVYFIPGFTLLMLLEVYLSYRQKLKVHEPKDSLASIGMGIGSLILGIGVKFVGFGLFLFLHQFAIFDIGYQWWAWVLLFFADDLSFYWHHRLSHHIRILWAAHINHHSSENYNLAVALRQSWTELFYKYIFWLWLPILGFEPVMIFMMMGFSLIYQFWVHTKTIKSLGPLEWIMNTPWDRIFGTFQKEEETDPVVFGITSNIHTHNLFKIAFHEFQSIWKDIKSAPNLKTKLGYIFMPPGWSHDGRSKTSDQLRTEEGI
jgi:sterol desaturase/sphingolipid hydroxylase (fatty acid hydroxylase superfamily)